METIYSSEISVEFHRTTRQYMVEEIHARVKFKSYNLFFCSNEGKTMEVYVQLNN
jgi:hypothetical protein